ncbi:MAG: hypothetical protein IIX67_05920 [Clostridia bacterium]|nr:hypothetical protein [Clostridia bacterium]
MKLNAKKTRRVAILLGLVMMLTVVLASCVDLTDVPDFYNDPSFNLNESEENSNKESDEEVSVDDKTTAVPTVAGVVNIEPTKVAVYGTCEENATITVEGGIETAQTKAHGSYYVIEVDIHNRDTLLRITAKSDDKENASPEKEIIARKDATADTLLDGNSVSIGLDSRLYFDKFVEDASGKNLYTASQLSAIREYVSDTVTSYYNDRAGSQAVELIYVLVPNSSTLDLANGTAVFPEGVLSETNSTIYSQVLETLGQTRATVVDLLSVFKEASADSEAIAKYGNIYRETDSALSDYGAYLAYAEIMNVVAQRFPDAAPKTLDDFTWTPKQIMGGNLVKYRGLDQSVINENSIIATPNFSLDYGTNGAGSSKISALNKFVDKAEGDYNYFTDINTDDGLNGIAERWLIDDTTRTDVDLPSALIYRDYSSLAFSDILSERFGKVLLGKSGELAINLSATAQYAEGDDKVVDYIIVIVSEENLDTAFSLAVK